MFFQVDLCDSIINLQQIDWCIQHYSKQATSNTDISQRDIKDLLNVMRNTYSDVIGSPAVVNNNMLKATLLKNCECIDGDSCNSAGVSACKMDNHVTIQHVINAFCHPNVISAVKRIILKDIKN